MFDPDELLLSEELVQRINALCPESRKDDLGYSGRFPQGWPSWYFYGKFLYHEYWPSVLHMLEAWGVDTAGIRADIAVYHAERTIGACV